MNIGGYLTFTQLSLILLSTVQLLSSFTNPIHDCDETFNYWEPTHYLMHRYGLQTWEYSPVYALRSYFYVGIHACLGYLASFLAPLLGPLTAAHPAFASPKIGTFYLIRLFLGLLAALSQTVFLRGIYSRFGPSAARLSLIFLILSPGVFFSSTAFLPSSFCMVAFFFSFGHYFRGNHFSAVIFAAMGILIAWPFPLLMLLPMALDLLRLHGFKKLLAWGLVSALLWLVPSVAIDYAFYRKLVLSILQIFLYNATADGDGGSQLYGVEPWTFYFYNGFLNFNLLWLLALASPLLLIPFRAFHNDLAKPLKTLPSVLGHLFPMFAWLGLMLYLPHKEERFLYVMYPLIVLNAALSLVILLQLCQYIILPLHRMMCRPSSTTITPSNPSSKTTTTTTNDPNSPTIGAQHLVMFVQFLILFLVLSTFTILSLSRIVALTSYYNAPLRIYHHFNHPNATFPPGDINICVGKEWYRFPSNFFLPEERFHIQFIRSGFHGQLPQPFTTPDAIQPHFNDRNREEPSRYIEVDQCHYLVDLDLSNQEEPHYYTDQQNWEVIDEILFLDAANSHPLFRAFAFPFIQKANYLKFRPYFLLKRKNT